MSLTSFLGLGNEESDMNCFLNSSLQALFHLPNFNTNLLELSCTCMQNSRSCLARILQSFYLRYIEELEFSRSVLFPIDLRQKIAELYNNKNFAVQEKADSMEVFNVLLTSLHNSFNGLCDSIDLLPIDNCQCFVHRQLILDLEEIYECECGSSTVITNNGFQNFIADKFAGDFVELNNHKEDFPYTLKHHGHFSKYLKQQFCEGLTRTCVCEKKITGKKILKKAPECLIIQIVNTGKLYNKLSTLELFVSLNSCVDISEIYGFEQSQNYNLAGLIINLPGHYIYMGRIDFKWWLVNDDKVSKVRDDNLIEFIKNYRCKIVGVIYHKGEAKYEMEIKSIYLSYYEKEILKEQECFNCKTINLSESCQSCGFNIDLYKKNWLCEFCEFHNKKGSLHCLRCGTKRFKKSKTKITEKNYSWPCRKCHIKNLNHQKKFCNSCGLIINYDFQKDNYLCDACGYIDKSESICFLCTSTFWTCHNCGYRESTYNQCSKCSWLRGKEFWYCHQCKKLNQPNALCQLCKNPNSNLYCLDCGEQTENKTCSCYYKSSCSICHQTINTNQPVFCRFCGQNIHDNYCETCCKYIPKKFFSCKECKDPTSKTHSLKACDDEKLLCCVCQKYTLDSFKYCWVCSNQMKEQFCEICMKVPQTICYHCLKLTYRCHLCKNLINDGKCRFCDSQYIQEFVKSININKPSSQSWECMSCNFFNKYSTLFCEICNLSRDYNFITLFTCEFCKEQSHSPLCLKCSAVANCSSCEKVILFGQKLHCPHCGTSADDYFCANCNLHIGTYKVLCKLCTLKMEKCDCGFLMHPKSLMCRHCTQKAKFIRMKCFCCKNIVLFNFCCFCGNQILKEGSCSKCKEENSYEEKYYCRMCSLNGSKCGSCKERTWTHICKKKRKRL